MSKNIVDLEMGEDGSYAPKETIKIEKKNKKLEIKKYEPHKKPKHYREYYADEFLSGIDLGLDFIDKVVPRVERLLRLKG